MKLAPTIASLLALAAMAPVAAAAQPTSAQMISGTRLDLVATGEVTRVPDIARISAGVTTSAPTASAAIEQNARVMASVRAALKRAGIADRDIQTSAINLYPEYRQDERGTSVPQLVAYRAGNEVSIRFRDIANSGRILDALVAEGANQINGPTLGIDKPEEALDEARVAALASARARAALYARAMGKRVGRIISISESGAMQHYPQPMMRMQAAADSATRIDPGEQAVSVSLSVSFELE